MRIVTGFMPPTNGTAVVSGFDVVDNPLDVKRRIGYMPETPPLYVDMTVEEYLNFAARLKQIPAKEVKSALELACEKVDLNNVRSKVI